MGFDKDKPAELLLSFYVVLTLHTVIVLSSVYFQQDMDRWQTWLKSYPTLQCDGIAVDAVLIIVFIYLVVCPFVSPPGSPSRGGDVAVYVFDVN